MSDALFRPSGYLCNFVFCHFSFLLACFPPFPLLLLLSTVFVSHAEDFVVVTCYVEKTFSHSSALVTSCCSLPCRHSNITLHSCLYLLVLLSFLCVLFILNTKPDIWKTRGSQSNDFTWLFCCCFSYLVNLFQISIVNLKRRLLIPHLLLFLQAQPWTVIVYSNNKPFVLVKCGMIRDCIYFVSIFFWCQARVVKMFSKIRMSVQKQIYVCICIYLVCFDFFF